MKKEKRDCRGFRGEQEVKECGKRGLPGESPQDPTERYGVSSEM